MTQTPITPDLIRAALAHVPANLPRDDWARVAMAIKSEYPDETGFDLFDTWSQSAEGYDPKSTRSTWRSIKAGGGVAIGTLLHLAKEHGFALPKGQAAAPAPTQDDLVRRERERAARQQTEQARIAAAHEGAASEAAALWAQASPQGVSPYLQRKGVQAYGLRFAQGGWLLVPVCDGTGKLWNLQRIAPEKPAHGDTDKLFLKGGRKSGLWHWCGNPEGAAVLLVCEGYATGASLHEATGYPVAVAFDAGNLAHVARAVRERFAHAELLVCGDDDVQTHARTGKNPGREKATAAARAAQCGTAFPEPLADGQSDLNDLHQSAGLDAVRACVQAALDAYDAQRRKRAQRGQRQAQAVQDAAGAGDAARPFDRFTVDDAGVWYSPPGEEAGAPRKVCPPLHVTGLARDGHDNQAALLLEFDTPYRSGRRWLMPLAMLSGDGAAYRSALLSQGFMAPTDGKRRAWLTEYLQSRAPAELVRHVPKVGWHGRCYVLPDETLGQSADGERVMFHSEMGIEAKFGQRGTLQRWRDDLARVCVGNTRAAFAVSVAFAGPLLAWASGTTGGGFHFTGQTSIGKTTGFLIAASVWGKGTESDPQSYMQKWRATSNGLEYLGEQHNDCTLILDELGQMENGDAGASAYMLADGMGKARAKGMGGLRQQPTCRLLFLSSGEITLAQQLEAVGKRMKGGQEVRLIPIPAEVREGSALEHFHEFDTGHELAAHIKHHTARCYGVAGRAWLEHLVNHTQGLAADLRTRMDGIEARMVPELAAGQVKRGGRRFALVAAAGEMATAAGLTGWPEGEATRAATACFNAWLDARGGSGSSERADMLRQVRRFLEKFGEGRFSWCHRALDDRVAKTVDRAGFRRMLNRDGEPIRTNSKHLQEFGDTIDPISAEEVSVEYLILPEVFRDEVCKGFDHKAVAQVLKDHGCLVPDKGRAYDTKQRLLGSKSPVRCYRITPSILAFGEAE